MRTCHVLLTLLLIHATTATIDLQKLKDTAKTKFQTITDTAAAQLQTLQNTASTSLQQFADTIDFEKVQKLDFLNLLPKIQYKGKLIKDTYEKIPEYSAKVKFHLQSLKGLKGKDVALAFEAPWPVRRRIQVIHYEY